LGSGGISEDWNDYWFVSKEYSEKFPKTILKEDDVIMSVRGSVGTFAKVGEKHIGAQISPNLIRLSPDNEKMAKGFLFYSLKTRLALSFIIGTSSASAVPAIRATDIREAIIPYPPLPEQSAIAEILSSLDDKIELNQQMNNTLEKNGQALFKHWFIDFEFPNEEGKSYRSSGGEMVDSELGEIPKGWEIKKVSGCGKVVCGKTPPTSNKEYYGDDISFITIPDMRDNVFVVKTGKRLSEEGGRIQSNKELPLLAVCVSCIATPGLVSLTCERSHTNQQINSIICNSDISPYFMYFSMKNISKEIKTLGLGGTATLNLNTGDFSKIELIIPDNEVMHNFHQRVEPIFIKIMLNSKEEINLSQTRDSLLPKLMSGKIRVNMEAS
jgi:type I restriction enzyme S subunit